MPTFSNGWLRGFQARRDVKFRVQHGEAGSLGDNAAIEMLAIQQALSTYAPQDIFNCDETSLYWRLIPDRSLTTRTLPGRKKEKSRISALFCCNSNASERLPIWFIGTAKRPKAFATAGINIENLGCVWRSNKKAWMTTDIFKEWLLWFDNKMNADGRKVALLMDNRITSLLMNLLLKSLDSGFKIPLLSGFLQTQRHDINLLIKASSTHGNHTGRSSGFFI